MSVIAFIATIFCIHAIGRVAKRVLRVDNDHDPVHAFLISCALGMILLSGFAFTLLSIGIGYRIIFAAIIYIGGLWGFISSRNQLFSTFREIGKTAFTPGKPLRQLFAYVILFFLLLTFYITLAPTTAWDALTYHYPLPAQWLEAHSFVEIPEIIYSNFPSSAELIFIYGFSAHSDILANHLTWFAGFLCVLYLFHMGRKYLSIEAGLGGAIILLSYPVVFIEGLQGGYIDLVQTFYMLALLDALGHWSEKSENGYILLTGIFSGFLLCIKYSGLLTFVFAFFYIIFIGYRRLIKFSTVAVAVLLLTAMTWLLPIGWYIKSYLYTGNPVYPFLYHNFGGTFTSAPDIMYWANPSVKPGFVLTVLYPIFATFSTQMVQLSFRLIPPSILVLIPFIFFSFKRTGFRELLLHYVIYSIALISIIEPSEPRYNLAAWALLGMLGLDSAFRFSRKPGWFSRIVLPLVVIIPLAVGSVDLTMRDVNYRHSAIWAGQSREDYYLGGDKYIPLDCYPVFNYLNNLGENDTRALIVEPRVFVLDDDIDYIIGYPFQTENLWDWDKAKPDELPGLLDEYGFTHIAITYGPNYRGMCEAWFIMAGVTQVDADNKYVWQTLREPGMGNKHFMRLAGYSSPHLTYDDKSGWDPVLRYDGRFANIEELFASKGNIDVKLPASIIYLARQGKIERAFTSPSGLVYKVIE